MYTYMCIVPLHPDTTARSRCRRCGAMYTLDPDESLSGEDPSETILEPLETGLDFRLALF